MKYPMLMAAVLVGILGSAPAAAQDPAVPTPSEPSSKEKTLEQKIEELRTLLEEMEKRHAKETESLREEIQRLQETQNEEVEAREDLEDLVDRMTAPEPAAPTAQRLNVFNPQITVFGDFLGRVDDKKVFNEEGDRVDDSFNLREVELDLRASVDPWADAVVIVTLESETPGEYETSIEEGYVTLKRLPVLDSAPLGLRLKVGRFRPEFGWINRVHLHDLPWTNYPLATQEFLGEEGFIQNGISAQAFIPTPGEFNSLQATFQWLNGGDIPVAEDNPPSRSAFLGRLGWFWDLGSGHDMEVGSSVYSGDGSDDVDSVLYGVDFLYRWRPYLAGAWRSFLFGGEAYLGNLDQESGPEQTPFGAYAWSQYQFDRNVYLGARYDYTQEVDDDHLSTQMVGMYLTYYTTEFLRFRLGYQHVFKSDVDDLQGLDTFLLQVTFVFGSHPVEPYWVNR